MIQIKKAELILSNGVVYTAGPNRGPAGAVAVSDGRIAYVGTVAGAASWMGPDTRLVDLEGRMVLPGFHDGHIHAVGAAAYGNSQIPLAGLTTKDDLLQRVLRYMDDNPDKSDYMGIGWSYATFPATGPGREDLDAICPHKPVFLLSCDGHTAWVNSPALNLAGIGRDTTDPPGGHIVRHPTTNEPTGWLKEPAAFRLILNRLSLPDPERMRHDLVEFFHRLSAEGITSILQPGVELYGQEEIFSLLSTLDKEGELPLRITGGFTCNPRSGSCPVSVMEEMKRAYRGRLFRVSTAKIFLDGVMESRTARLLEPYSDLADHWGKSIWSDGDFREIAAVLDREQIQMHIHAIGDGAVRLALDGIQTAIEANGHRGLCRHTLAHLDLTARADIPRFRRLGVIACFQPTWFHMGREQREEMVRCLGEKRAMSLYLMRSFMSSGAVVTCGSDYPAEASGFLSFRPLDGIEMGHTRRALGGSEGECYLPEERASLSDLINSYTINGAFQFHHEKEVGSIEVGKLADLVVLDRNLFDTVPRRIHEAKVLLTLLEGREVFRDDTWQG